MTVSDEQPSERESVERYDPRLAEGKIIAAEHEARYRWASTAAIGKQVLDAGCGVGYGSAMMAEAGAAEVVGTDIDPAAIEAAETRYRDRAGLEFRQGDLRDLPFVDESFDLVVCFEAIEHVDRQDAALDELRRVIRPHGHLLVSSPNRDVYPPGNPHHVHEYVPEELAEALSARFREVELWRQHTWLASLALDDEAAAAGPDVEIGTSVRKLTALAPGSELYTLAIAGDVPLSGLRSNAMLCEPIEIRELILSHMDAHSQLRERTDELLAARRETADAIAEFEGSISWRITRPLRAVKRLALRERRAGGSSSGQRRP
jgi:SAM-dependent methyltransferase